MFSLDIISKSGLLIFSHNFIADWCKDHFEAVDADLKAGLFTASINALRETQKETVTSIHHEGYIMLLYEGHLTRGILTTNDDDPKLTNFLKKAVSKFEFMFSFELDFSPILNRSDFACFRDLVVPMYNEMMGVDIEGLRKILDIMNRSRITNFIIYETKYLKPIFTSIVDPRVNIPVHSVTKILREIECLCVSQCKSVSQFEIDFQDVILNSLRTETHWIVCLSNTKPNNKSNLSVEISELKIFLKSPLIVPIEQY